MGDRPTTRNSAADPPDGPARIRRTLWQSRVGRLVLVGASIVPMVLCVADYDIWWLAFVAWIPLLAAIEGLRPRGALFYGWLIGTGTVFWGFFWMTTLLEKFAGFGLGASAAVTLLFAAYHGLLWGFAAMATAWLERRTLVPLWITAPLCWVAAEATIPNIFPIYMAQGWAWQPLWIQTAELGGVTTVSAIMVAINAGAYCVWRGWVRDGRIDRPAAAFTSSVLVLVPLYGAVRIAQVRDQMDAAPKLHIGVVQGNMSILEMAQRDQKPKILARHQRMSAKLADQGAEMVLWGETAYPNGRLFTRQSTQEPPPGNPWRIHVGFDVPAVIGAVTRDTTGESPYPYNTALFIDGDGKIAGSYDKVYRLIFGEYVPLVDPAWYLAKIPSAAHLEKGEGPKAVPFLGYRLGPFICYEDILPRYVRQTATQSVHVFVNLTNDAWFGKTHEPAQHLGLAVFRTVEHRKAMVRAVNTGVSAYIDPTGTVQHRTRLTDPDVDGPQSADGFVAEVPMMDPDHRTPYGRTGELWNALCILSMLLIGWRGPRRPVPRAADTQPHPPEPGAAAQPMTAEPSDGASKCGEEAASSD
jgi:apolipoprotein N-acyltransferase